MTYEIRPSLPRVDPSQALRRVKPADLREERSEEEKNLARMEERLRSRKPKAKARPAPDEKNPTGTSRRHIDFTA